MKGLKNIRTARREEAKRFSQEAIAAAIGVSRPKYIQMEEDPSTITRGQADKLADYLGCSVDDIFLPTNVN